MWFHVGSSPTPRTKIKESEKILIQIKQFLIRYLKQDIKLIIQYDIDTEFYPEKKQDKDLQGILVMQIWGDKKIIKPIMHEDGFIQRIKEAITELTSKKIVHIPEDAWPEKESDWPIIRRDGTIAI